MLAGHDSINTDASEPKASTPCSPDEKMIISYPCIDGKDKNAACGAQDCIGPASEDSLGCLSISDSGNKFVRVEVNCPESGTINVPGDWHEIMSTHWFHDHSECLFTAYAHICCPYSNQISPFCTFFFFACNVYSVRLHSPECLQGKCSNVESLLRDGSWERMLGRRDQLEATERLRLKRTPCSMSLAKR